MSISFSCPCGKRSDLPESFLGKRVRCNFCGALSVVSPQEADSAPEPDWETHVAESLMTESSANGSGGPGASAVLESDPATATLGVFDRVDSSAELSTSAASEMVHEPEEVAPRFAEVANPKQYKVLTQRDKWFGGRFDAERLEAAINFLARQGWVVRSMCAGSIAGLTSTRDELVVLLEKD